MIHTRSIYEFNRPIKMYLSRIHAENYRSIKDVDLELSELQVVFGRNNSGKSNLLSVVQDYLRVLSKKHVLSWDERTVRNREKGREIRVGAEFILSQEESIEVFNELTQQHGLSERLADSLTERLDVAHRLRHSFNWEIGGSVPRAELSINPGDGWHTIYKLRSRDEKAGFEVRKARFHSYPESEFSRTAAGDVDKASSVIRETFEDLFDDYSRSLRWISPFRKPNAFDNVSETYELRSNSENLTQVLHTLSNNQQDVFNKIVSGYTEIMEGVTDLTTPISDQGTGTRTTVSIHEGDVDFDLKEVSSGSMQILSLLTEIETAAANTSLLLVEEPETHLHPGAQRVIYQRLRELADNTDTQIIVTTHSDVFVEETGSSQLVKADRRGGDTQFREIDAEDAIDELEDLGYDKSGLLQSRAVVFVEGRSDELILRQFCKTLDYPLDQRGVQVVDLEGDGNMASDGQSLVKLLTAFDIPFLFVADSHDEEPREVQNNLLSEINAPRGDWNITPNDIFVWEGYGIESYLVNQYDAIAAAIDEESRFIANLVNEHSEYEDPAEILNAIYSKTVERGYHKDSDGVLIAKRIAESDLDDDVEELMANIKRLV